MKKGITKLQQKYFVCQIKKNQNTQTTNNINSFNNILKCLIYMQYILSQSQQNRINTVEIAKKMIVLLLHSNTKGW